MRVCVECGEPLPENARYNKRFCEKCRAKHLRESTYRYYHKNAERLNEEAKMTRAYYVAHGICIECHKRDAVPGIQTCQHCRDRRNKYNESRREQMRKLSDAERFVQRVKSQEKKYAKK